MRPFSEELLRQFPATSTRVQKTQITFSDRHVYACVSFARVKKKAELPDPYLVVTLGLPYPLNSDRVAVKTTHIVVSRPEELDGPFWGWVSEAHNFAENK